MEQRGLNPTIWGPDAWNFLHAVTYASPSELSVSQQQSYANFFRHLGAVLPCSSCRTSYNAYLEKYPPATQTRRSMIRWLYDIHDLVNAKLNKKSPSFDAVMARLDIRYRKNPTRRLKKYHVIIIFLIVVASVVLLYVYNLKKALVLSAILLTCFVFGLLFLGDFE